MTRPLPLVVRGRQAADLPVLLDLLQRTHESEGYPVRAAAVSADWLAAPGELANAVSVHGGRVTGHIALHPTAPPGHAAGEDAATAGWQRATGVPAERLAVISRLFTARSVAGAGSALLAHAIGLSAGLGREPVLLVDPISPARAFYRRRGWQEVGTARQQWGHRTVDAVLMVVTDPLPAATDTSGC